MSVTFVTYTGKEAVSLPCGRIAEGYVNTDYEINFNNANAMALLQLLGVEIDPNDLWGDMPIDDFRTALDIADAMWDDEAAKFVRDEETDGNFWSCGLDQDGLRSRLERLKNVVVAAKKVGAIGVVWS